jgi:AsmA protein
MALDGKLAAKHLDPARAGLVDPGGGFAGLVDLNCRVVSDGRRVTSSGTLRGDRIRIMPGGSPAAVPVSLAFQSEYDLNTSVGVLKRGDLRIGRTSSQLNGRFNLGGNGATLQMRLAGRHMSIPDLEATLPAIGIRTPQGARFASGTLDTNLAVVGSFARLSMSGPVTLSNAALVGFDLGSQMRTAAFLAGIPTSSTTMIQTLTALVHIVPGGVRVDGLNALVPSIGSFTGAGTISPSGALNFNLLTRLNRPASVQGQLLSAATLGYSEQAFRLHVTGTIDRPIFVPDVPSAVGGFAKRGNPLSTGAGFLGKLLGKWK